MKNLRLSIFAILTTFVGSLALLADGWPSNYGGVMLQGFYWDCYNDGKGTWSDLTANADEIANYFDIIWVPNAGQSAGSPSMGYLPIYWFTNYNNSSFGNEAQLRSMINTYRAKNVNVIMDLVLNHRAGVNNWADFPSETWNGTTYKMDMSCICRTDEINRAGNPGGATGANDEGDDFDGGRDLDHTNAKVQQHCKAYCDFLLNDLKFAGFRLDMVKGYAGYYTKMYNQHSKPRFSVGEYWDGYDNIANWINSTDKESAAFDFPFKYALNEAMNGDSYNMGSLCWMADGWDAQPAGLIHKDYKRYAVTFVDNHDTGQQNNPSRFTGNPLAANALMLCMPGTPCVFLPHWLTYKSEIKQMIAIRKACGVTNTSGVRVLQHTGDCFMAEVYGNKGKLVVKIGPSMASPAGYSDSQIKASGTNWCIWADVAVPAVPGPVDCGEYKVYWDNSQAKWAAPKVHYFGGTSSSAWPGVAMTKVPGKENVYELTVANGTTGLVFNNGSDAQTDDQNAVPDHLYGLSGDKGTYDGSDTGSTGNADDEGSTTGDKMTIYFDNRVDSWSTVKCYYEPNGAEWPGTNMTHLYNSIYKMEVPKNATKLAFNNGNSGYGNQTGDITSQVAANYIYYNTGNVGSIMPAKIYVVGSVEGSANHWKTNSGVELAKSGNVYRGQVTLEAVSGKTNAEFSFVQCLSSATSDWEKWNSEHRYGSAEDDTPAPAGSEVDMRVYTKSGNASGACRFAAAPGTYYMTADFNNMKVKLEPMSISLNKSTVALATGATETLVATVSHEDLSDYTVTWTSSDAAVASVSTNGTVTAKGKGSAVITAHLGSLEASCNVYVGKTAQNILWSQTLNTLKVGDKVNLTARSTSNLAVTYSIINGADVVSLQGSELTALRAGIATVEATQTGGDDYAPAQAVSKTVTVSLGYVPGDVLEDDQIGLDDAVAIVQYILGNAINATIDGQEKLCVVINGENRPINVTAADLNGDSVVDVVDASLVVNIVADQLAASAPSQSQAKGPKQVESEAESGQATRSLTTPAGKLTIDEEGNCRLYTPDGTCIFQTKRTPTN